MKGQVPLLIRILHCTFGPLLMKRENVHLINDIGLDLTKGPYLLLANHVHTLDPIVVSAAYPRHIRWVAGAYLFKLNFMRLILTKGATAIPKQQGRTNMSTIREMQNSLKKGEVVGIFPEGTRTWDGDSIEFDYKALAKMVRIFSVPVVYLTLEGAYAKKPRWSDTRRKGKGVFNIRVRKLLPVEEMKAMDMEALVADLKENLHFSNDQWKKTVDYDYTSPTMAEGLERVLYLCPKCGKAATISTKGSKIFCSSCGVEGLLDSHDDIESEAFPRTVSAWHRWERSIVADYPEFQEEKGVLFQKGNTDDNGDLETLSEDITVALKDEVLSVKDNTSGSIVAIPYEKILFFVVNAKQTMEIITDETLYRIRLLPLASSIKYLEHWEETKKKEA